VFGYTSVCCSAPAAKSPCGTRTPMKDAESGKMKDKVSGLGKWRCSGCHKVCKVTRQTPAKTLITSIPLAPTGAVARYITVMPYVPYAGYEPEVPTAPTQS
jgi:transposase-like protein